VWKAGGTWSGWILAKSLVYNHLRSTNRFKGFHRLVSEKGCFCSQKNKTGVYCSGGIAVNQQRQRYKKKVGFLDTSMSVFLGTNY